MFRKKTFTGLSTNCFSFISYSFTPGLIRTLVDRAYKINNTWLGFHEDIKRLTKILKKNLFPAHLVERVVNRYLTPVSVSDTTLTFYNKLLYIGPLSVVTEQRVWHLARRYCNNIDIKLVFPSFRVGNMFGEKDAIPLGLRACVVYKFFRPYFHYHFVIRNCCIWYGSKSSRLRGGGPNFDSEYTKFLLLHHSQNEKYGNMRSCSCKSFGVRQFFKNFFLRTRLL